MSNLIFKYSSDLIDIQYPQGVDMKYLGLTNGFHYVSVEQGIDLSSEFQLVNTSDVPKKLIKKEMSLDEQLNLGLISKEYKNSIDLKTAQENKNILIEDAYSLAQFALVTQNGSVFKMELKGNNWLDFERQLLKASINAVADLIAINEAGVLKVLKDIPFAVLQPLYKSLCGISVGNYTIKNQLLYQVNNAQDSSAVKNIVIAFPEIQTFTIG